MSLYAFTLGGICFNSFKIGIIAPRVAKIIDQENYEGINKGKGLCNNLTFSIFFILFSPNCIG